MSAKKAPKPTSKAPPAATGASAKSASKTAAKKPTRAKAKSVAPKPGRVQTKAAPQSSAPQPVETVSQSSQATPSNVQRKAVHRAQPAGKRSVRTTAPTRAEPVDEPLIEPAPQELSRPRAYPPLNEPAEEPSISPQLRRGFVMVLLLVAGAILLLALFQSRGAWWTALTAAAGLAPSATPTPAATQPAAAKAAATDAITYTNRVGIISGHRGNDSGAVCPDGLTEAQVNFDAATRVASILRAQGYTVDVLDEFDARLKNYRARALLSIHADSCADINELATGYKVARTYMSAIPDEEDKLVACVSERYKAATGLKFHHNTVTHDMLQYHAFREVDVNTPSAIIELGFLNLDRDLLTRKKDTVAKGVSEGLLCYLRGETP